MTDPRRLRPVNGASTASRPAIGYVNPAGSASSWWVSEQEDTPELRWPRSLEVYDSMRRQDAQIASVLRAVTLPVRRTPWRINPAGARDEVVQHVADDLGLPIMGAEGEPARRRGRDRFSWLEHLRLALLMLPFGHMFFEQVYRVGPGPSAHLAKLEPRFPRTIADLEVARDGGLVSITQWPVAQGGEMTPPIPVNRLVGYVNDREGADWFGHSLLRPAYKHWLIKDRLMRVQAQTIERNGMGVPLYKGQEDAEPADLEEGKKMAMAWRSGQSAGTAVPFGADLVLRGVEGTLPDAQRAIDYHDQQIARNVLGHFMNLGSQTGSWALGSVFADFFTLSLQTVAQQVADIGTQHVVEDIVDANWGPDEPAPALTFDEIGSRHDATAEAVRALLQSGALRWDPVLEQYLRTAYGLPPVSQDTPPPAPPAGDPAAQPPNDGGTVGAQ